MRHLEVKFLWLQEIVHMGKGKGGESEWRHQHCGRSDQVPRHRQAGRFVPTAWNRATRTTLQVELKGAGNGAEEL